MFGNQITAEQVFVLTSFYNLLRQTMTIFFPQGIGQIAEANVSIKRLNKFLLYDENKMLLDEQGNYLKKPRKSFSSSVGNLSKNPGIYIRDVSAKWTSDSYENTLSDLNIEVKPGRLVAVIGPVGSGKSSLLHAILKELPLTKGEIEVNGQVSYASQEPWLFAGSVRQNILFGQQMDKERYKIVVKKCALERDFELFPYGDKTIVGERGVSLSGGQRARINLARAVYKEADIYLLDDPLSAVDTHVGKQLFDNCITGYLRDKTVILITHQLQYLKEVDCIFILQNGCVQAQGTYMELQESGLDFAKLLHDQPVEEEQESASCDRRSSIRSVTSTIEDKTVDIPVEVEEQKSSGSVGGYVYKEYLKAGGNWCVIFTLSILFILTQVFASGSDYFITYWYA